MVETRACVNEQVTTDLFIPHWTSWETVGNTSQGYSSEGDDTGVVTYQLPSLIEDCSWDAVTQMPLVCVKLLTVTSGVSGEDTMCRAEMASAASTLSSSGSTLRSSRGTRMCQSTT